jgi:hypothetical protein
MNSVVAINRGWIRAYQENKEAFQCKDYTALFHNAIDKLTTVSNAAYYSLFVFKCTNYLILIPSILYLFFATAISAATNTTFIFTNAVESFFYCSAASNAITAAFSKIVLPYCIIGIITNVAYSITELVSMYRQISLHTSLNFNTIKTKESLILTLEKLATFSKNYQKQLFPTWLFKKISHNKEFLLLLIKNLSAEIPDIKKIQQAIKLENLVRKYNRRKIFGHCLGLLSGLIGTSVFIVSLCTGTFLIPLALGVLSLLFFLAQYIYNKYLVEKACPIDIDF